MVNLLTPAQLGHLESALRSTKTTSGTTHDFYHYPARFSPEIARAVIETLSEPSDWILDPFMGGGTAIIEGLALGRSVIGVDLNALAHFVATVRTRPLSLSDEHAIRLWARETSRLYRMSAPNPLPNILNLPADITLFIAGALRRVELLYSPRQCAFARTVLLRMGQWALDCRDHESPPLSKMEQKLPLLTEEMLIGLREFVQTCNHAGLRKDEIAKARLLLCRSSEGLETDPQIQALPNSPRLVFTSPPYPRVHVLYHRWQVRGRQETPAPYWIAQVQDGYFASHYTGGSRTSTGELTYFAMIQSVFSSVRQVLAPESLVVQLVGFSNIDKQLPRYLAAMSDAGFDAWKPSASQEQLLWRRVPNRKWYAKLQGAVDASSEVLLFHRPRL